MKLMKYISNVLGYKLIKKKDSPLLDEHIKKIIERYEIDLVIDVGANNGQFGRLLRETGYEGDILSFEPVGKTFVKLRENCANDNKWRQIKLALGNKRDGNHQRV